MGPERDSEDDDASAGARERALADHARFVDANLKRNFRANFIHGVLGMTGFRLIYAPTIIPAYLMLLTGSAASHVAGASHLPALPKGSTTVFGRRRPDDGQS